MSFDDKINAYFVRTGTRSNDEKKEEQMSNALALLSNQISTDRIRELRASEGYPLIASGKLTKKDVFIFDYFEGDFFEQLKLTKSLIIGPPCLSSCLLHCEPIPLGTSPVYTTAMRDLQISATGISPQEKEKLKVLIEWMGGHYFQNLGRSITHLISNTIKSTKYEHATLNGKPVMHVDWVQRVWEKSCAESGVLATDVEFDKYRLPIFFGTNITCTGLDTAKKDEVMRLVNENGGSYQRAFRSQYVDIVITEKNKTNSDKYQAAVRFKKDILLPEWIFDSVQKGFALPTKAYQVKAIKASTPTKGDQSVADFTSTDHSQLSDISRISGLGKKSNMTTVNETMCSTMNETIKKKNTFLAPAPPGSVTASSSKDLKKEVLKKASADAHYRLILEDICPRKAKKAGTFLDGCNLYLSGFRNDEREKLNKIVNAGGAIRYDAVNEEITHIIVGQLDDTEFRSWKNNDILSGVHIVRLDWLLESIKLKQPASEAIYRVSLPNSKEPDAPSPSSKKTLMSMNHSFKHPDKPIKKKLFDVDTDMDDVLTQPSPFSMPKASSTEIPLEEDAHHLLAQYSQENTPKVSVPLPSQNKSSNDITTATPVASSTHCNMKTDSIMPPLSNDVVPRTNTNQEKTLQANPSNLTDTAMTTIDYEHLDCFRGVSLYIDKETFPEEFYNQIIIECEAAHGNVVSSNFRDPVDYAVVSFEHTVDENKIPVKARHIVTDLYVEICMKENKLMPIEYYHKHIPTTADIMPLKGMTVVTSIYALLEKDFIESLSQLLGAKVNKSFVKKEMPLLVCPTAEGSKYEGALKWRYPVVTSEWLVQCAIHGRKIPYTEYLVGKSVSDFPVSPTLRERNLNSNTSGNSNEVTMQPNNMDLNPPPVEPPKNVHNDPNTPKASGNITTDFTPLRNKRVSELAGPLRSSRNSLTNSEGQSPESPNTPTNNFAKASYNFEFMEKILSEIDDEEQRECLREVIEEMRNNQTPELERIRRQACTPVNRKIPTPKGIPDFCTTPEFEQRMADEFEKRWRLPTKKMKPDTPIEEIRKRVIKAFSSSLGIPYHDSTDKEQDEQTTKPISVKAHISLSTAKKHAKPQITSAASTAKRFASCTDNDEPIGQIHPIRSSPANTPLHHKTPRNSSMAPRSIFPSDSSHHTSAVNADISDGFVPNTQSPNLQKPQSEDHDSIEITSLGQRASLNKNSTINFDKISFEETEVGTTNAGISTSTSRLSNPNTSSNTLTNTSVTKAKNRSSSGITSSPEVKQITEYLKNCENRRQSMKRNNAQQQQQTQALTVADGNNSEAVHYVQPFESEQFGFGTEEMVGWRDPAEFSLERRSKLSSTMQYKGQPRFSISCADEAARQTIIEKILKLGGQVCENLINFDPECTHFVCERPNRGEKMLGCISSGKWVLSLKYIEESFAKDVFIDEELYEWGNCKALNLPQLSNDEQTIAQAAHRWRVEMKDSSSQLGAFLGFRAILRVAERSLDALKNVLKAGNAEIIDIRSPYNSNEIELENATHCFVDMKKAPLSKDDYKCLIDNGVQVYTQMYINAYLMVGKDVEADKYAIHL